MEANLIQNLYEFEQLKTEWDAVYAADPHAQIFLSWTWLRGWFEVTPYDWFVLGIRRERNSPYVAFFPLAIRSVEKYGLNLLRELNMGGFFLADYTGFICLPEYEEKAIATFATYTQQQLSWDELHLKEVIDPRLEIFINFFEQRNFNVQQVNSTCFPYIPLPNTWEQYLQEFLGWKARKSLRHQLRAIESRNEFQFIQTQVDNFESQLEALLKLWQMRWGIRPESELNLYRTIFRRCFDRNCLWLNVLWKESTPVAATANYVEPQKKVVYGCISGYDAQFSQLSPGRVIVAHGIKTAIENGCQIFDFLRGDEDYKFSFFGAKKRFNTNVIVKRKNLRVRAINQIKQMRQSLRQHGTSVAEKLPTTAASSQ